MTPAVWSRTGRSARTVTTTVRTTVAALVALGVAACGTSHRPGPEGGGLPTAPASAPSSTASASTAVSSTAVPTTRRPTASGRVVVGGAPTGVGVMSLLVVDPSRPTVQHGRTLSSSRRLPTTIRYPAVGPTGAVEATDAAVAAGRWPLVVFAHGYDVTPATYAHLLHAWSAAGFVVAAPAFPLETAGGPLDENDLSNEPRDISVVISALLQNASLAPHLDPSRIAVAGHSDGAEAALGAGFVSGDGRIGPVISMAAQGVDGMPHPDARHPLLVVQGTEDTINPPARSDGVYAAAGPPKFYLHLIGGGHLPPVADDTPWRPIVEHEGIDFLRRYLDGGTPVAVLEIDGSRAGLSSLTADP